MATKLSGWCGKLGAIFFTSIVAPVLVNLVTREPVDAGSKPTRIEQVTSVQVASPRQACPSVLVAVPLSSNEQDPLPHCPPVLAPVSHPVEIVCIIARGNGRTPAAALQDALGAALRQALAAQVDAQTWDQKGATLCACVLRDRAGLILGWRKCSARKEWKFRGAFYQEEVAVEVNLRALLARLRDERSSG